VAQHCERRLARRAIAHAAMPDQHFGELRADGERRVERRHRFLKDHREPIAAQISERALVGRQQVAAVENDRPVVAALVRGMRPMIESAVTLLPHPDSTTRHTVSPGIAASDTPSTARAGPDRSGTRDARSSMSVKERCHSAGCARECGVVHGTPANPDRGQTLGGSL